MLVLINKYGKSLHDIYELKQDFFQRDKALLEDNLLLANVARRQPKREKCKNCTEVLMEEPFFIKHNINYYICKNCGHLNGEFEDTNDFAKSVYVDEITSYSKNYSSEDIQKWNERVKNVYNPKAEFLLSCLKEEKTPLELSVLDIGAGSGYFIKALMNNGFQSVGGYEVSAIQSSFANIMLKEDKVKKSEINELVDVLSQTKFEIVSMIGVLEHLTNPREILNVISKNKNIKYYYLSLPLFSFAALFEIINEDYFNRHLSGGHTHLYTNESIEYFCKEFNFQKTGQWFFGIDAMDLFRFCFLKMKGNTINLPATKYFQEKFLSVIDDIQLCFDKAEFSSEVHILLKN